MKSIKESIKSICEDICSTSDITENYKRAEAVALLVFADMLSTEDEVPKTDSTKKWNALKEDIELAVQEGIDCGYDTSETVDGGKFYSFRYVLDKMKTLDGEDNISNT